MDKLNVNTPMGNLVAFQNPGEAEYPGIAIALADSTGTERILTLVEYQPGQGVGGLCGYDPEHPEEMAREMAEVPECCRKGESGIKPGLITYAWPNPWGDEEKYNRTFHFGADSKTTARQMDGTEPRSPQVADEKENGDQVKSDRTAQSWYIGDALVPIPAFPDGYTIIDNVEIILPNSRPSFYKATGITYRNGMVSEYVFGEEDIEVGAFIAAHDGFKFLASGKLHVEDELNQMDIHTVLYQMDLLAGLIPGVPKGLEIACSCSDFEKNYEKMSTIIHYKKEF